MPRRTNFFPVNERAIHHCAIKTYGAIHNPSTVLPEENLLQEQYWCVKGEIKEQEQCQSPFDLV